MLLNKVLSQMRNGVSISIQDMADRLFEDPATIKHAVTLLCRLNYCEQITLFPCEERCSGCLAGSCASIPGNRINYWQLTDKGSGYLRSCPKIS